jgi:2-polyprenyl-3-methyl-5-hydroxy-6-metoxy-1,4-benzoquinol methylase
MNDQAHYGNHCERIVFSHEELIDPSLYAREIARYEWAMRHVQPGQAVLELGCTCGYGTRFLPEGCTYVGVDYDEPIVQYARREYGAPPEITFVCATIDHYLSALIDRPFDVVIALEVIEHVMNGRAVAQRLKGYAPTVLISTPYQEPPGFWGPHHVLHLQSEADYPGFEYQYLYRDGGLHPEPDRSPASASLMLMRWTR